MQTSDSPNKISIPFARDGNKRVIPNTSQIGISSGAASYPDGFPPVTFIAKENGGIPPAGVDFNGVIYDMTTIERWLCAGGKFKFDTTFATSIGGYPKGAALLAADGVGIWINTLENNSSNPDAPGSTGWVDGSAALPQLKAAGGAYVVGFQQAGAGAATTVGKQLEAFTTDGGGTPNGMTPDAAVSVSRTRTTMNIHAFEDHTQLNVTDTNLGYAAFDAKPVLNNANNQEHFVGYQSRPNYTGAGDLTGYMDSHNSAAQHNGAGAIANARGFYFRDVAGSGVIVNNYGIFIDPVTRGINNYSIWSLGGKAHFKDIVETYGVVCVSPDGAGGFNYGIDTPGKKLIYGYSTGVANFGTHEFYDGKNNKVMEVRNDAVIVTGELAVSGNMATDNWMAGGRLAFADLPTDGIEGSIVFCTNGRKVGQSAGNGTGVPVYRSNGAWRVFSTDAAVTI